MSNHPTHVLGGEPVCRSCGAPLASDQRYCLACGVRVGAPRLDFLTEMEAAQARDAAAASAAVAPVAAAGGHDPAAGQPPAPPASRLDKIGGPMGAAAVVLVALGIGFLIGEGGNDPAPVAQRAPVVNIQGGLGGAAPAADPGTTAPAADDVATGDDAGGGSGGAARARTPAQDAARVQESVRDIPTVDEVPDDAGGDLTRLRSQPLEQSTGSGPVLRRDNRAAGGGTEAETIG